MPLVRPARATDALAIQAIYAPIVSDTPISFEVDVPSVDEMRGRIENTLSRYPYVVAQTHDDGAVVGYAYAAEHRTRRAYQSSVDVTVYVAHGHHRCGVGRALYGALLSELSARGFHSACAGITLPNSSSVALHEAMGFKAAGVFKEVGFKLGRYHDVGWWQRML
ncbi:MAG: arsinothricin resistance N-acetyltransferase ArsN1 family B [Pseudomonadota bacterium]